MKKKSIIVALTFSLLMCGCNRKEKNMEYNPNKSLTLNLQEGDPPSLNPYCGVDLRSRCLFLTLFEPLMRRDSSGNLQPAAAESVEISPDQMVYTFHLRPHSWSNGEPVTSKHFEQAWKFCLMPKSPCIRSDLFYPIKNAKAVKTGEVPIEAVKISCPDEKTLVVELEHPAPYFLDLTASSFFLPLYTPSIAEPQYFNGPYMVAGHAFNEKLTLHKNPSYWDAGAVEIENIDLLMVRDPMTAFSLFEKGKLDIVGDPFSTIPFDIVPTLQNAQQLKSKVISRIFYLLTNTEHFPLNNKNLRKALGLSIDRDLFTEHLFLGQLPTFSLLPKTISLLNADDIAAFKQEDPVSLFETALQEMGLTRETFPKITLSYAELTGQKQMAEFVRESWKEKLGIEVELKCSEWNVHSADLRRKNYDIGALHLTTLYQDPMFYFDFFRDAKSATNYCKWEHPTFQDYLFRSEHTVDHEERKALLKAAEAFLMNEMPAIPVFTQNFQYLKHDDVDLSFSDLGIYDFKSARKNRAARR